ncbi:hypothetical protein ACJX0J_035089 [Zea mays]
MGIDINYTRSCGFRNMCTYEECSRFRLRHKIRQVFVLHRYLRVRILAGIATVYMYLNDHIKLMIYETPKRGRMATERVEIYVYPNKEKKGEHNEEVNYKITIKNKRQQQFHSRRPEEYRIDQYKFFLI